MRIIQGSSKGVADGFTEGVGDGFTEGLVSKGFMIL
jgi:hypothetical protein